MTDPEVLSARIDGRLLSDVTVDDGIVEFTVLEVDDEQ